MGTWGYRRWKFRFAVQCVNMGTTLHDLLVPHVLFYNYRLPYNTNIRFVPSMSTERGTAN